MKNIFEILLTAVLLFLFSCKENEVANNNQEKIKIDTVATLEIKDTVGKETVENKECLQKSNYTLP